MKNHVANLLKKQDSRQEKIVVLLDRGQMELVEKLSAFFSRESMRDISTQRVVQEAVKAFTDESVDYISAIYGIDLRSVPLTEVRARGGEICVEVAARDTLVLPVRDNATNRQSWMGEGRWTVGRIDRQKLPHIQYLAAYWSSPVGGITHYARIRSYEAAADGGAIFHFDAPEELGYPVRPKDPSLCLRSPRYTNLALLFEAKHLEDIF